MPYRTIQWIKLEKRLLNDYRFYSLPQDTQLFYIKLLLMAAETSNKMPKSCVLLRAATRSTESEERIAEMLELIRTNFPKFKANNNFYYFVGWNTRHNRVYPREAPKDTPQGAIDKIKKERIERIRKEYIAAQNWDEKDYTFYGRDAKAIKTLLLKVENDDLVIEGIKWIAGQGYTWTIETLIRKWPDFMAQYKRSKDPLAKYEVKGDKRNVRR